MDRRGFIKLTGTTIVCTCFGALGTSGCAAKPASDTPSAPAGSYRINNGRVIVALPELEGLTTVGGAVKLALNGEGGSELKVIVLHSGDEDYRAFADSCTHKGKELDYLHKERKLACCGRSSQFDLAGNVIRGPAEDALLRYRLRQEGEELVIEL
jgi:Rieske Fe-S protein